METDPFSLFPHSKYHIIADSAFDDRTAPAFILHAYKDSIACTVEKINYNKKLSRTRLVFEHTWLVKNQVE